MANGVPPVSQCDTAINVLRAGEDLEPSSLAQLLDHSRHATQSSLWRFGTDAVNACESWILRGQDIANRRRVASTHMH